MTGPGSGDDFVAAFLDDYFAECEEHFTIIRRALLDLEGALGDSTQEGVLLEELFRSFHSLKGISAMVDLRDAERMSHELESCLRGLRDRELATTPQSIGALIDGTAMLETVIAARRAGAASPAIDEAIGRLESLSAAAGDRSATARNLASSSASAWRFTFVPSAALVDRGVKVDTVRARLASIGRIAHVAPKVLPEGGIAFEFRVEDAGDESLFAGWSSDGLSWQRVDPEPDSESPSSTAAAPGGQAGSSEGSILAASHFVRVDLKRLDAVMHRVADLVVTRSRLDANLARIERLLPAAEWRGLQESALTLERQLRDLREDVMRVRLVQVDEIFRRMPFVARDVAREVGKDVRVVLSGQDTEIDKFLVERMMDPILHLVRNAVSHGIETPQARAAAGKPSQGVIRLAACTIGESVVLEVADDGAGIDASAVAARAREHGTRLPEGPIDARTLTDLLCEAGFSTRSIADRASGRGMGMAVVRTTVQDLGGSLTVDTEVGLGTRFTVTLPLTLAITDALIALVDGHTFAVPQSAVEEVIEIEAATVRRLENNEIVPHRGRSLPLLRLRELLGLRNGDTGRLHALVIGTGREATALGVDRIVGQREIVVRAMSDSLLKIDGFSGATELGDGRVVLILDAPALVRGARTGSWKVTLPPRRADARRREREETPA